MRMQSKANESSKVPSSNPLKPSLTLLMKLGSIAVHADEFLSSDGHEFDKAALDSLLQDPKVKEWIMKMGPMLPRKQN